MEKNKTKLISEEAIKLLNYRIQQEELSARLYESMSLYLNDKGYINSAKKWKEYSDEEWKHSGWAKSYLLDFGYQPELDDLEAPIYTFDGLPDIINKSYDHEVEISRQCQEMAKKALEMGDFMLFSLAQKYNAEQVEEVGKLQTAKDIMETFGTEKHTLLLFDSHINEYL